VDEPSKFQEGKSSTLVQALGMHMVLDLKSKPEPPTQMYSAIVVSFSAGRVLNLVVNLAKLDSISLKD